MRKLQEGQVLNVRAIGGLHVVTLAWDFAAGQEGKSEGLLGFAIERSELKDGNVIERYFLHIPTDWQDETAIFLLVGVTFLTGAAIQARRGHVGIEAVSSLLSPKADLIRQRIQQLRDEGKTVKILCVGRKGRDQLRRQYASMISSAGRSSMILRVAESWARLFLVAVQLSILASQFEKVASPASLLVMAKVFACRVFTPNCPTAELICL